jgi:hypothetical protein
MSWEEQMRVAIQEQSTLRRTVICEPEHAEEIQRLVTANGLSGLWKVRSSYVCPAGKILLIDETALRAAIWGNTQDVPDIATYSPTEE